MMKLRALEPSDLDILYNVENDVESWDSSESNVPFSYETLNTYIYTCSNDIFQDKQVRFVVDVDGITIGLIDLCNFSPLHNHAEVSIYIVKSERGKGWGTKAISQICKYAFENIHIYQLYAIVKNDNEASKRVFEKSGFTITAKLKSWIRQKNGLFSDAVVMQRILADNIIP